MKDKHPPHTPFLQADFIDAQGVRHRSYSQTGEDRNAYCIADFEGRECIRIGATTAKREQARAFFQAVADLVKCSNREKMVMKWELSPGCVATPCGEIISAPLFAQLRA